LSDDFLFCLSNYLAAYLYGFVHLSLPIFLLRLHGSSGPSETFGNECLAHDAEFELKNVEVTK
jgi:hypothetical protein